MVGFTFKSNKNLEKLAGMRSPSGLPFLNDATVVVQAPVMQTAPSGQPRRNFWWVEQSREIFFQLG